LPGAPGVYMFKDATGEIVYIGKAKSLKKRVQSYFNRNNSSKTRILVSKIADLEYRLAPSEIQAQILELALIKEYRPHYNVSMKDDKSFPWVKITHEEFPVVCIVRRKKAIAHDKSLYFGPFTNAGLLHQALKMLRKIFGFRSCKKIPRRPCLYYRLKLCPAPCAGKMNAQRYNEIIKDIKMFFESKNEELLKSLFEKMQKAAQEEKFEEAAQIRNQIFALGAIGRENAQVNIQGELEDLKDSLRLEKTPQRIEAFDISNIFGKEATGSMVSFYKGVADKDNYRRFRIRTVEGIDDYGCLSEVVKRRYSRLVAANSPLPDLILIDGGRSHLAVAAREIKKLGLNISLVSIAKDKENIYTGDRKQPLRLQEGSSALNLIRRVRDEAHRFAVSYHHLLRRKKIIGK